MGLPCSTQGLVANTADNGLIKGMQRRHEQGCNGSMEAKRSAHLRIQVWQNLRSGLSTWLTRYPNWLERTAVHDRTLPPGVTSGRKSPVSRWGAPLRGLRGRRARPDRPDAPLVYKTPQKRVQGTWFSRRAQAPYRHPKTRYAAQPCQTGGSASTPPQEPPRVRRCSGAGDGNPHR